ncbi:MAG: ATP-binding cassette domain-containing protein [Clostridia bacterium]
MTNLVVSDLCKAYDQKIVLSHFSHIFPAGETTYLMGKSGCGKTTLLHILMGFGSMDAGTIDGLPKRIACVFQEDRLCEDFSAVSNVRLVCGHEVRDADIRRELSLLGLKDCFDAPVRTLSGGMKRRVAIARAVMYRPQLLLLDEAYKGLDEQTKQMVIHYVNQHCKGVTVLAVTHDAEETHQANGHLLQMEAVQ